MRIAGYLCRNHLLKYLYQYINDCGPTGFYTPIELDAADITLLLRCLVINI